jgi:hypothetical protein
MGSLGKLIFQAYSSAQTQRAPTKNRPRPASIQKRRKNDLLTSRRCSGAWARNQTFALHTLARQLTNATDGFSFFASTLLGWLFVKVAHFHFAENAFALHLFLERAKRLINIVVADEYLHGQSCLSGLISTGKRP